MVASAGGDPGAAATTGGGAVAGAAVTEAGHHVRGTVLVTAGVLCLVPDSTLIRLVDAPSLTTSAWRGALVSLTVLGGLALRYRRRLPAAVRATGRAGALSAVLWAINSILFVASIDRTAVANTLVIVSAAPLVAAVLTRVVLGEPVARRTWLAIPVATAGVVVTMAGSLHGDGLTGDLLALGVAVTIAANLTLLRHHRDVDMLPAVGLGGFVTAAALVATGTSLALTPGDLAPLLAMGALFIPAALVLITVGTRHLPSPEVSLLLLGETVLGPLLAWVAVGETVGPETFAGGALVVGTLAVHSAAGLRAARAAPGPVVPPGDPPAVSRRRVAPRAPAPRRGRPPMVGRRRR